jgi:hypothetical protein
VADDVQTVLKEQHPQMEITTRSLTRNAAWFAFARVAATLFIAGGSKLPKFPAMYSIANFGSFGTSNSTILCRQSNSGRSRVETKRQHKQHN